MLVWTITDPSTAAGPLLDARRIIEALALTAGAPECDGESPAPRLLPVGAAAGGVGALLVPLGLQSQIARNGVPLPSGAHLLRHADRLDYAGRTYWVAAVREVREVPYDAAVHGDDVYCYITKSRLRAGEPIVVCPGRPGAPCDAIYRKPAWEMALEANARFRCPRCRFEPAAGEWRPTVPRPGRLEALLALAARRPNGGVR